LAKADNQLCSRYAFGVDGSAATENVSLAPLIRKFSMRKTPMPFGSYYHCMRGQEV